MVVIEGSSRDYDYGIRPGRRGGPRGLTLGGSSGAHSSIAPRVPSKGVRKPAVQPYVEHLIARCYAQSTRPAYVICIAHFAYWISNRHIHLNLIRFYQASVQMFLDKHLPNCEYSGPVRRCRYERQALLRSFVGTDVLFSFLVLFWFPRGKETSWHSDFFLRKNCRNSLSRVTVPKWRNLRFLPEAS
jgi:hypothetical protein